MKNSLWQFSKLSNIAYLTARRIYKNNLSLAIKIAYVSLYILNL
jgi:hypothetical protein